MHQLGLRGALPAIGDLRQLWTRVIAGHLWEHRGSKCRPLASTKAAVLASLTLSAFQLLPVFPRPVLSWAGSAICTSLLNGPSLPVLDIVLSPRFQGYYLGFGLNSKSTLASSSVQRGARQGGENCHFY